jgi:hypothetical protein
MPVHALSVIRSEIAMSETIQRELGEIKAIVVRAEELLNRHDEFLFGSQHRNGLLTRVDRLEQKQARWTKHLWIFWGAVLTGLASWIVQTLVR